MLLRKLPCFNDAHEKLVKGRPAAEVADFIQGTHKMMQGMPREALTALLRDYRKSLSPVELARGYADETTTTALAKLDDGLDEIAEMEALYRLQRSRIDMEHRTERKIGKLFPGMRQEVDSARDILIGLAKIKDLLGVLGGPALAETSGGDAITARVLKQYGENPQLRRIVDRMAADAEGRQRVLSITKDLQALGVGGSPMIQDILNEIAGTGAGDTEPVAAEAAEEEPDAD